MRKALWVLLGVVAIAVIGWSAVWFIGRPEAEKTIRQSLSNLGGQGVEVTFADLDIAGFPFAYQANFTDLTARIADQELEAQFPSASGAVAISDTSTTILTFPDHFTVADLSAGGERFEVESDGLEARITRLQGDALGYALSAKRIAVDPRDAAARSYGLFSYTNPQVSGTLSRDRAAQNGLLDVTFAADSLNTEVNVEGRAPDQVQKFAIAADALKGSIHGDEDAIRMKIDAASLIATAPAPSPTDYRFKDLDLALEVLPDGKLDLAELIAAQDFASGLDALINVPIRAVKAGGTLDLDLNIGPGSTRIFPGEADTGISALDLAYAGGSSTLDVRQDKVELRSTANAIDFSAVLPDAVRKGQIGTATTTLFFPALASSALQESKIQYNISDLVLDDETWAALDPQNAIDRKPGAFTTDISMNIFLHEDLLVETGQELDTTASPMSVESFEINDFTIDLLELFAQADGTVDLNSGKSAPEGWVEVTMKDWQQFLQNVQTLQFVDPMFIGIANVWIGGVAVPSADGLASVIRFDFKDGSLLINGKPFEQIK
ncbi:MAG: DUF2125 domain-containing protein [Neomegalonema sp.]|nr:DUF2125 domain-containing protein [Neomegalonema sp.]